jgi:ketosteroid isomerase-like protein
MDGDAFGRWLDRYFAAWSSNDPNEVAALFSEDAEYWWGPFREPARGRDAIVRAWIRGGAPRGLRWRHETLAVADDRGIAHWRVAFAADGGTAEIDGILICSFDADGRCTAHREWFDRRAVGERADQDRR